VYKRQVLGFLLGRHRIAPPPLPNRGATGRWGERVAADYLRRLGLKILYRNYATEGGEEIDLVCREGEVLVFVEVRTRSESSAARPIETVHSEKRRRLVRASRRWLQLLNQPEVTSRFDVTEVILHPGEPPEIHHHRDAFQPVETVS